MAASKIAVIEGDRIGEELVLESVRAIEAAARLFGLNLVWEQLGCVMSEKELGMGRTASTTSLGMAIADAVSIHAKPKVAVHG